MCPVCGHQNAPNASVCARCGAPLSNANQSAQMCPECGADCSIFAQHCPRCRQPLPLPERRLLGRGTVLAQRYKVERLLGWGGFGAVYLAQDLRFKQRKVAVKENHDFPTSLASATFSKSNRQLSPTLAPTWSWTTSQAKV